MDTVNYLQFVLTFALVIGLIGLMAVVMRRYADPSRMLGAKGNDARIKIMETRFLDSKRRLVLVSRDEKEHLLLLGDNREMLIETFDKVAHEKPRELPVLE